MDLFGARLEQRLQDAVHPDRLQELLSGRLEMSRLLQKGKDLQQSSAGGDSSLSEDIAKQVDIERAARCRSIIDLRIELEQKIAESGLQCSSLAEELARAQESLDIFMKSQAEAAMSHNSCSSPQKDAAALHVLSRGLEEERRARQSQLEE